MVARAQLNKQAFVRSPKGNPLRPLAAAPTESPLEVLDELKEESPIVEKQAAALLDDFSQKTRENISKKGFDFSTPIANMQAYQAKLLEVTNANSSVGLTSNNASHRSHLIGGRCPDTLSAPSWRLLRVY